MSTLTYIIEGMRPVKPKGKVAEANPDRFLTVHGTAFFSTKEVKGELVRDQKLSIHQKEITFDMARSEEFAIDKATGVLTLPTKGKGRNEVAGLTAEQLEAELASLREPEAEEASEATEATGASTEATA